MSKKIIFYGGTGQGKVMRPIADNIGELKFILDDTTIMMPPFSDIKLYNGQGCYERWKADFEDYFEYFFSITIGNPHGQARRNIANKLIKDGLQPISLIHDKAVIENYVKIKDGVQVHARAVINPFAEIGNFNIINTGAIVEHDCLLQDGVEIGPGAVLCGNIHVGENSWIGAGSVIRQNIKIGKNSIVGAGSVVIRDVQDNSVVVGNPARTLRANL